MTQAYSTDLRGRVIQAAMTGMSAWAAAERFSDRRMVMSSIIRCRSGLRAGRVRVECWEASMRLDMPRGTLSGVFWRGLRKR
ncbi:hypothetical protein LJE71_11205 [Xanthobacter autotrophicus]|uniref:hypothetical protein n=1 Tax=Xanthobacter autotrophicus TaxID=280 RepID=UPI001E4741EE|nr:hypothetical protein [Xanthobacter autotrophicus]UDQ92067.1 hypothetical protein LJE71_11205 [Xanthobacter autotrophicus]